MQKDLSWNCMYIIYSCHSRSEMCNVSRYQAGALQPVGRGVTGRDIRLQRSKIGTAYFMAGFFIVSELFYMHNLNKHNSLSFPKVMPKKFYLFFEMPFLHCFCYLATDEFSPSRCCVVRSDPCPFRLKL